MTWRETKSLLCPAVLTPEAERLLQYASVRDAMRRLLDGEQESTVAMVDGQAWRVTVRKAWRDVVNAC